MKKHMISLFVILLVLTACDTLPTSTLEPTATATPYIPSLPTLSPDNPQSGQNSYSFLSSNGEEIRYLLYLPDHYDANLAWPVIVFFHGSDGNGLNIKYLKDINLPKYIDSDMEFPFIVVSPQMSSGTWGKYIDPLDELLDYLIQVMPIDSQRIYATGYSSGGYGTWKYARSYPDRLAAIAPIAGGASISGKRVPDNICILKELPIWVFHGEADKGVPPEVSTEVVDALKACDANVKLTLYPDTNHIDSWPKVYADPSLYEWFLEQSK